MDERQEWDYYWMPMIWNDTELRWEGDELVQLGREGWELVSVVPVTVTHPGWPAVDWFCFLKRPRSRA